MSRGRPSIDPVRDRDVLLDHPTRRRIARLCRARPRSVTELAKALQVAPPALRTTVENMEEWKILCISGKTKRGAATYTLSRQWHRDLAAAIRRHAPEFLEDQHLLRVASGGVRDAAQGLLRVGTDDIAWAVALDGGDSLLVGLVDATSNSRAEQLRAAAESPAAECVAARVRDVVAGQSFEDFARGVRARR